MRKARAEKTPRLKDTAWFAGAVRKVQLRMSLPGSEELPPPKGGPDAPTPSPVKEGKANESPEEAEAEVSDGAHSPRPLHKVGSPSAGPRVPTAEPPPE